MLLEQLREHVGYVSDAVRLDSYRAVLSKIVKPGDHVVDLGCGTGILGLLSLRSGAGHVTCIDETAMIEVAKQTFHDAGYAQVSSHIRGRSQHLAINELADVLVCDHVGFFGVDYAIIPLLQDARQRFLKPGGSIVPDKLKLFTGAVHSPAIHSRVTAWAGGNVPSELRWLNEHMINTKHDVQLTSNDLLGPPAQLGEVDLKIDQAGFLSWSAAWRLPAGVVHGIAGWFECSLCDQISMTNSPLAEAAIDRPQAYFPIREAVEVEEGDVVELAIMLRPAENLLAWTVSFPNSGKRFSHADLSGFVRPQELQRSTKTPKLSNTGQVRLAALQLCDGRHTIDQITETVRRKHQDLLPTETELVDFVADVIRRNAKL